MNQVTNVRRSPPVVARHRQCLSMAHAAVVNDADARTMADDGQFGNDARVQVGTTPSYRMLSLVSIAPMVLKSGQYRYGWHAGQHSATGRRQTAWRRAARPCAGGEGEGVLSTAKPRGLTVWIRVSNALNIVLRPVEVKVSFCPYLHQVWLAIRTFLML